MTQTPHLFSEFSSYLDFTQWMLPELCPIYHINLIKFTVFCKFNFEILNTIRNKINYINVSAPIPEYGMEENAKTFYLTPQSLRLIFPFLFISLQLSIL